MPKRILIVDDDSTSLKLTASQLEQQGYVVKAMSHAGGLESAVESFRPDGIIMDLIMPDVDGPEAVHRLRQSETFKKIPVIFLTAVNMRDDESGMEFEVGVDNQSFRTLIKPVDARTLALEIEALTGAS